MKIAIVGSRTYKHPEYVAKYVGDLPKDTEIISGGAIGPDTIAVKMARERGMKTTVFEPDWKNKGKIAGFLRNSDIVANADHVVAFWDGVSKGTEDTINKARKLGIPVTIIYENAK
jgi:hypothetical protein